MKQATYGLMESVATSMTNHIRSVSTVTVPGQMGTVETYVHVRWVWLMLPAVLIVSSAAFLALAILETGVQESRSMEGFQPGANIPWPRGEGRKHGSGK